MLAWHLLTAPPSGSRGPLHQLRLPGTSEGPIQMLEAERAYISALGASTCTYCSSLGASFRFSQQRPVTCGSANRANHLIMMRFQSPAGLGGRPNGVICGHVWAL